MLIDGVKGEFTGTRAELELMRRRSRGAVVRWTADVTYGERVHVDGDGMIFGMARDGSKKFNRVVGRCVPLPIRLGGIR